jgi:hypothetical protein
MAKTPASWEYPSFNNTLKFPFRIQKKKKPAILFPQLYIHTAPMEYSHSFLAGCEHGIHIQAQKLECLIWFMKLDCKLHQTATKTPW